MVIPSEVAVMTLPSVTLFPQALLPLYIFEKRYQRMLADSLASHRLFVVAMQKPRYTRETPSSIAGLGLIRVAVDNDDKTSHLILQGITRVELGKAVSYKPYRVHEIRPLQPSRVENSAVDGLVAKVRHLAMERVQLGSALGKSHVKSKQPSILSMKDVVTYLNELEDADQVADLVSCALLPSALERQRILETVDVEPRLKQLIHFLMAEISHRRKNELP